MDSFLAGETYILIEGHTAIPWNKTMHARVWLHPGTVLTVTANQHDKTTVFFNDGTHNFMSPAQKSKSLYSEKVIRMDETNESLSAILGKL